MDRLALFLMAAFAFPCLLPADSIRDGALAAAAVQGHGLDASAPLDRAALLHVRFADTFGSLSNPVSTSVFWVEGSAKLFLADAGVYGHTLLPFQWLDDMPAAQGPAAGWVVSSEQLDRLTSPDQSAATQVQHTAWGPNRLFRW